MRHLLVIASVFCSSLCVVAQTDYDAKILSYEGLRYPCDGESTPALRIQNIGTNTMLSCEIDVWKNGLQIFTFDWQLAVAAQQGEVRQPILPVMPGVLPGDELEFRILTVNGVVDEDEEGNIITIALDDVPVEAPAYTVLVDVRTGDDPGDLEWQIKSATGSVLASGGPYTEQDQELQVVVPLSPDACFELEVLREARSSSSSASVKIYSGAVAILEVADEELTGIYRKSLTTGNNNATPCTDEVTMEVYTDLDGGQTTWTITDVTTNAVVCSGGPYTPGLLATVANNCCLPHGCYILTVFDAAGNGMVNGFNGGYQLRLAADNSRIIDSRANGAFGAESRITGNTYSFCLPMGSDALTYTSCDKYWWKTNDYIVAAENITVSALHVPNGANSVQPTNTGYEFWFYAPKGGYSFRKFRSHAVSDGFANVGATRACHLKVNNWGSANHIPEGELMNVRVRGRVNGSNSAWGPACRFVRDQALAQCPPTKLMDIPGNQFLSCGQFRDFVSNQRIHARPVSGATQYEWRFRIEMENVEIIRTSSNYFLNLGWSAAVADPLLNAKTYDVDVRAFKNGNWCVTPPDPDSDWGDVCSLTIGAPPAEMQGASVNLEMENTTRAFAIWPNPNRGDRFEIAFPGGLDPALFGSVDRLGVEVIDLTGKQLFATVLSIAAEQASYRVELPSELSGGLYLVRLSAGDHLHTVRMVVRP